MSILNAMYASIFLEKVSNHEYQLTGYFFNYLQPTIRSIHVKMTISIVIESVDWNETRRSCSSVDSNSYISYKLLKKTTPKMIMWDATVGFVGRC